MDEFGDEFHENAVYSAYTRRKTATLRTPYITVCTPCNTGDRRARA